ncbi:Crp/Fnr family transcriptional regulator [Spirosoma soli]|uniref:Crp/Fnr family transcriptional regulator n=1 Tax=Spirosoma soli TaxID=1770529 RepID=A0ABW5M4N2_9BACT
MQEHLFHEYLVNQAISPTSDEVRIQRFDRGTYIYQPGDAQTHIHLIQKGVVKIGSYSSDGERVIYDVLQPGEFFGDLDYLNNGIEFFEFAKAATSITVFSIELAHFKYVIVHDPVASEWFNRNVVRRWWKAETRLLHMTRGNIDTRLDNLRREYHHPVRDNANRLHTIFDLLSQQDIADLTGTTRQTASKKLKQGLEAVDISLPV